MSWLEKYWKKQEPDSVYVKSENEQLKVQVAQLTDENYAIRSQAEELQRNYDSLNSSVQKNAETDRITIDYVGKQINDSTNLEVVYQQKVDSYYSTRYSSPNYYINVAFRDKQKELTNALRDNLARLRTDYMAKYGQPY